MHRIKLLPSNRLYAFFLVSILLGSTLYSAVFTQEIVSEISLVVSGDSSTADGRPIVKKDGRLLLWASGRPGSQEREWFDVTDSKINPRRFNHGIGKDRIASIDGPVFVTKDDPRLASFHIDADTPVIGYAAEGEAKAYPIHIMNRHEIVNDTFGDTHLTVAW